jgi:AcrR family transcriptional regulator
VRDETWAAAWDDALHDAAREVVPLTEERRGTTIRDTRAIARRLATSAVTLFAERGFDDVTVSEIAAHAGVTSRTFFRYFPSKETVIVDIYDRTNRRLMELLEAGAAAGGDDVLPVITAAVVQWCDQYGELFPALVRLGDASPTLAAAVLIRTTAWEEHLAEALCAGFPALDRGDADIWACTTMAMLRLLQRNAEADGVTYAKAARKVFGRLGSLTAGHVGGEPRTGR